MVAMRQDEYREPDYWEAVNGMISHPPYYPSGKWGWHYHGDGMWWEQARDALTEGTFQLDKYNPNINPRASGADKWIPYE
jgi:hypothetical protein